MSVAGRLRNFLCTSLYALRLKHTYQHCAEIADLQKDNCQAGVEQEGFAYGYGAADEGYEYEQGDDDEGLEGQAKTAGRADHQIKTEAPHQRDPFA
jgi:hypothetical protein